MRGEAELVMLRGSWFCDCVKERLAFKSCGEPWVCTVSRFTEAIGERSSELLLLGLIISF